MAEGSILLVAGNNESAKQIFSGLKKCGFTIAAIARGGDEAARHLKKNRVDSILFDSEEGKEKVVADAIRLWKNYEIPIIFLSARLDHDFVGQVLDCEPYGILRKPWDLAELEATVMASIHKSRIDRQERQIISQVMKQSHNLKKMNEIMEARLSSRMGEINQITDMYYLALEDMRHLFESTLMLFVNAIELREANYPGHARRVAEQALGIGQMMELDKQQLQDIQYAALLHDVGLLAMPDKILQKPLMDMTLQERKLMERHCLVGEQLFTTLGPLRDVASIIRSHHELYNGKGFPDRLAGEEIPLGARILLVANDHDDLKSGAFDGVSRSYIEARKYLQDQKGKRYDPKVVDVFLKYLEGIAEHFFVSDQKIDVNEMQVDDVLARDIISQEGLILLGKGKMLTKRLIEKLRNFVEETEEQLEIYIEPREEED